LVPYPVALIPLAILAFFCYLHVPCVEFLLQLYTDLFSPFFDVIVSFVFLDTMSRPLKTIWIALLLLVD
jgi:hypothetical protein